MLVGLGFELEWMELDFELEWVGLKLGQVG